MNLTKLGTFVFLFTALKIIGQSPISGKVIDADNNLFLTTVEIININNNTKLYNNPNGTFQLNHNGSYLFKKKGYLSQKVELTFGENYIIQLKLNPSLLKEVVINGNHIPKKLKTATTSINIISTEDIERSNNINLVSALNRTPGVFMQTGALNTNRITIRGIGSRNLFGTSKIRAYFKDIPLTNGSGETNIEDFELGAISRLEINKGAVSSIYGAGLGGTITLLPKPTNFNEQSFTNEFTLGSFGLLKNLSTLNLHTKKSGFQIVYSNTESDGYRDNNEYNRQTFTVNTHHFISKKDELSFLGSYVDLKAFIPSSLNEEDYLNTPTNAAFTWRQTKGFEDSKRGIFGISWNHQFNNNLKQTTSIFTSFRDGYEPRPFNILSENTQAYGIRSRLLGNSKLFNKPLTWTLGGELFKDIYKYNTFENLYQDFPPDTGSVKGDELSNFKEDRSYYNLFFEINHNITEKTSLTFGLNLNKTSYRLKDRFAVTQDNMDQSGQYQFNTILSPKFGVSHQFSDKISGFASINHGFSPISLEETLLPDGQINTNIKPETGWNYEIGTRSTLLNNKLQFNISLYSLSLRNLLVARRTTQDQFIGINAGKTHHNGLEVSAIYQIVSSNNFNLKASINASVNNYKFKEFIDDVNDFSGNDLTGVPSEVINAIVDFDSKIGLYGNLNFQHIGEIPITDNNNLYSNSYNITNLKIGFKKNLNKKLKTNLFIGLSNIFETKYTSQILINASSFGGRAPRYYYPGNPFNYFSGINLNYSF